MKILKAFFRFLLRYIPRPWLIRLSYLGRFVLAFFMRGHRYTDPIDGRKYKSFLPYGYGDRQRPNALAPASLSLERHRLMWLYLQEETPFFEDKLKVLHIAPEQCFYGRFRKMQNLDYTTADIESPLADLKFDLHDIPLADNIYDVVFCNHVFEHVTDDVRCMSELYRVMKPGGWGIMQVPQNYDWDKTLEDPSITDREERIRLFGQYDHLRMYGLDYPERLEKAGFQVEIIDYNQKLSPEKFEEYGLPKRELLYLVRK